jgi:hypothetical protein
MQIDATRNDEDAESDGNRDTMQGRKERDAECDASDENDAAMNE